MTPYYQDDACTIYHGDNVAVMQTMESESIDLVVTSPPYDNLRTYGGHTWDFEGVADELTRLLKPGGVIVWVVNDATVDGSETLTSMRQAIYFKDVCGLNVHDTMIWEKGVVAFPESVRYNQKSEFMFVLSYGSPKVFNGIKDHQNVSAGRKVTGLDRCADGTFKDRSGLGKEYPETSLRGNVWHVWNQMRNIKHPAPFPESLARDHILSWSNEGDTVLDCFGGSGTTAKMAKLNGRKCISIDCNKEYCDIQVKRISQGVLF